MPASSLPADLPADQPARLSDEPPAELDCVVVGGGIAGAAVLAELARAGAGRVGLVEAEARPGLHATAQNAAMVRGLVFDARVGEHALAGRAAWNALGRAPRSAHLFRRTGSLLLASGERSVGHLRAAAERARRAGAAVELRDPASIRRELPFLARTPMRVGAWSADDGIADPAGYVEACLAGARARRATLCFGTRVRALRCDAGRLVGLVLEGGRLLAASKVVLAPGAWAGDLLRSAGLATRGLRPHRRHLFCTAELGGLPRDLPFIWHLDGEAYFRPEGEGVLFSACDADAAEPGRPRVAAGIEDFADKRLRRSFPFLRELPVLRCWAGLRTFTPDGGFLLGREGSLAGLHLAVGLGGHGVTCAPAIARVVAASVLGSGAAAARGATRLRSPR